VPTAWLDGKHTVFGRICAAADQTTVNAIVQDDRLESVTVEGDVDALLATQRKRIEGWNKTLDKNFPRLRPAGV
jgi:peptidyl-prolyl cis-trans isomerase B (cyclophilin B)